MHEDFEYVESLKKEIDELESEKADFSNIYDLLLEECVSKDVICSYLHSLSDLNAHTNYNDAGTSFNGQKQQRIDLNADALYNAKQENLRVWLLKMLISKKPVPEWPRSLKRLLIITVQELGIQHHSNEQSSSKLVPKVVPLADKTATSRQELELLFHHHIAMLRTTDKYI
ncbi:hypothetical protein Tco_1499594 [Tanacetum coccineum]